MQVYPYSIDDVRNQANATLAQCAGVEELSKLDLPGRFVFEPRFGNRLEIGTMEELRTARDILRKAYGWQDNLTRKFCSGTDIIAVYEPPELVGIPVPFELWVVAPPESFPVELLGGCKIEKISREEYEIICPTGGTDAEGV